MFGLTAIAAASMLGSAYAQQGQTVKIAFIDPLSGPFANVGQNQLKHFQFAAEKLSNKGNPAGVKFEIVPFDNKGSPQESLAVLKSAIDQGIRYVTQGNGSGAAAAILDAVNKHNERNPGKEVVFLNYAAIDPDLTNVRCSFWHFRFDAGVDMKMEALTSYMQDRKEIKNVYIIGQNYSFGQQVQRFAEETLARKRPDVKVVGKDLHPLGQVKDFAPFIAKIKAAGADTVITGNWGQDLTLLIKAANDAGLNANFYTYYAGVIGTPTAIGAGGAERVRMVAYWHPNAEKSTIEPIYTEFETKFKEEFYTVASWNALRFLGEGISRAKSAEPVKVAFAMEGLKMKGQSGEELEMRKSDHALQQGLYIATWTKAGGKLKHDIENTGYTFRTERYLDPFVAATPTSCNMQRPKS
jgi:branched-chain amino acid transport system substrate-binding protein